jgi:hypothetical protein
MVHVIVCLLLCAGLAHESRTAISFDDLASYYVMILIHDEHNQERVGIFSCKQLLDEKIVYMTSDTCHYDRSVWNAITSQWQNNKSEDNNCYPLCAIPHTDEVSRNAFILDLPVQERTDNALIPSLCTIVLDPLVVYKGAFIIPEHLVERYPIYLNADNGEQNIRAIDLDDDPVIIDTPHAQASKFRIFIRQVGVTLLMKYIALKEFVGDSWQTIKNNYYIKQLGTYLYARRKT